jgi:hypothetical protein
VKIALDWVKNELFKTAATRGGAAARGALEAAASGTTVLAKSAEATAVVGANAAEAASGAAASQAAIPFAGPALAAAAFASIMALVLGAKSSIPSARGGYDIPAGVNPLAQLHQEEMVLPAGLANPMRELLAGGGNGGAVHIHTKGGDFIHKNDLARMLKQLGRDFVLVR